MVTSRSLAGFLKQHRSIYLDTGSFLYFVERHPRYFAVCDEIFREIEAGRTQASTSALSLLEVLVQPYRLQREELVLKFYALLTTYPHLTWIPMDLKVADMAAKLRAENGLKTPDAIQAASAIASGASGLVCNDKIFGKVKAFEIFILDDHC